MHIYHNAYLANLPMTDPQMIGIFGEPNMLTEHHSLRWFMIRKRKIGGVAGISGNLESKT